MGGKEAAYLKHPRRVVLGLGANLGDRERTIELAIEAILMWPGVTLARRSFRYVTPPAGGPPQPDYLNCAVLVLTSNDLRTLLDRALDAERTFGRIRPDEVRWGPRTLDIDLLWAENEIIDEPGLIVPHPRLGGRVFALRPLLDVVPEAWDPHTGQPYSRFLASGDPIVRVD